MPDYVYNHAYKYAHKISPMTQLFDSTASKKPTNLSVNSDLLSRAKELKINLSATFEQALVIELKKYERLKWLKKNKMALSALNDLTEKNGLFSDGFRNL